MSLCPNTDGKQCICQPQDGLMCPHGPTPNDWKPWAPEPVEVPRSPHFTEQTAERTDGVMGMDGGQQ